MSKKFFFMAFTHIAFAKASEETTSSMSVNVTFGSNEPFINQDTLGYITEKSIEAVANTVGADELMVSQVLVQNIASLGEMTDQQWEGVGIAKTAAPQPEPETEADESAVTNGQPALDAPVDVAGECETCKVD